MRMSTIKRLYNSNPNELKQGRSSPISTPLSSSWPGLNTLPLSPLPVVSPTSPSLFRPLSLQKLFKYQVLLSLLAILLIPLAMAVKDSTDSSVDSFSKFNETTFITQTESTQIQRVTISPSYTSTNLKTGGSRRGNASIIKSNNNSISYNHNHNNQNNSHTVTPVRRNYSFSFSTSSSSASPVSKAHTNQVHSKNKNKITNKIYTVNNYNAKITPVKAPRRRLQPHQFFTRPRQTLFSADYQPQLQVTDPTFNQNPFVDLTTTIKPTMHPLRVLQTEISSPVKVSVVMPLHLAKDAITEGSVQIPVTYQIVNSTKEDDDDINLANHRMDENENGTKVFITATSFNNETEDSARYENHLSDEIRAQLDLINQRVPPNSNNNDDVTKQVTGVIADKGHQTSSNGFLTSVNANNAVEGRSASDIIEPVKRRPFKQNGNRNKGNNSSDDVTESKQLKSASINYFDQFTDNIAEEDNQYEVTELVNQYPAQYDTPEPGRDPYKNSPADNQNSELSNQNQNQQQGQASQLQPPLDIPTQNPNHNYHNQYLNNFYKSDKNRPKLNSYYDQNYYAADASNQHQLQQPQYPINNHYHHENQKHQVYKEHHYYANSDKGDYNGNGNEEVAHSKPGFGPHGQSQHPQSPSFSSHHHSSPFGPTGSHNSHFFNSHPPPQPYRGEHDIETSDAGNIMDRFEVFYTEHKFLTWGAFFIAGSLALACVIAYLYINHPPTEVVTARTFINEYLRDPGLLKFLSNLIEPETSSANRTKDGRRRRRQKRINNLTNLQTLLFQQAKEL